MSPLTPFFNYPPHFKGKFRKFHNVILFCTSTPTPSPSHLKIWGKLPPPPYIIPLPGNWFGLPLIINFCDKIFQNVFSIFTRKPNSDILHELNLANFGRKTSCLSPQFFLMRLKEGVCKDSQRLHFLYSKFIRKLNLIFSWIDSVLIIIVGRNFRKIDQGSWYL